ncbi:N utilization substance protein B [Candidatus Photodesmus blepharus]|uniref:Transcription antitermination protein NusB n=1 Tax=Candidatus Photodesmus blepharonis TaxID=1179155 RepID=A0A084CP80_9GAMM|nr:transcription antitermination factor NusB [Candidatus Photodesmus blepharus]KEY91609.1 N utilization substance protein B [Candidatus Photodesmus blepharus]
MFYQKLIPKNHSVKRAARRNARQFALQAIYSWQISKDSVAVIKEQFLSGDACYDDTGPALVVSETDVDYFCKLLTGVVLSHVELDRQLRPYLSRSIQDLDVVELALLRLAVYEILYCEDVPDKVVINEAIELAKIFAAEDSYKFVNGVLDKIVHK